MAKRLLLLKSIKNSTRPEKDLIEQDDVVWVAYLIGKNLVRWPFLSPEKNQPEYGRPIIWIHISFWWLEFYRDPHVRYISIISFLKLISDFDSLNYFLYFCLLLFSFMDYYCWCSSIFFYLMIKILQNENYIFKKQMKPTSTDIVFFIH